VTNPGVVNELKRIANEHDGLLEPVHVVEAASSAASPLHSQFEWDDTVAGHQYRLWQARQLISIVVEFIDTGKKKEPVKMFVSLKSDRYEDGGYRPLSVVLRTAELRNQLLEEALQEMQTFKRKYAQLKELVRVFQEMEKVKVEYDAPQADSGDSAIL
jgi:hypothetical protein